MFRTGKFRECGKGRVPGAHQQGMLVYDAGGIRPSDQHSGIDRERDLLCKTGVRHIPEKKSLDDLNTNPLGRRHFEPTHESHDEATRRANGRAGLRKFSPSVGIDTKHDGPYSAHRTWGEQPVVPAPVPTKSGSLTAEQKAECELKRKAETRPELREALAHARAEGTLIDLSRQVARQERYLDAAAHRDPNAVAPRVKATDLGAEGSVVVPPFATASHDSAPVARGAKRTYDLDVHFHDRMLSDARQERLHKTFRRQDLIKPTPYDTTLNGAPYPEPPSFGVGIPMGERHTGRARLAEPNTVKTDQDTMSLQRAQAHGRAHQKPTEDFVFHTRETPQIPSKQTYTLREVHEERCRETNERPITRGKGRAAVTAKTSLW